jgi:hypothetical protein
VAVVGWVKESGVTSDTVYLQLRVWFLPRYRNVTPYPYPRIPVTRKPWCYPYPCHTLPVDGYLIGSVMVKGNTFENEHSCLFSRVVIPQKQGL